MSSKRLVIIDGYSLLFRAFYGTRFLSTSDGRPTNALFGLTTMLFNLIEAQKPDAILVAFDAPGKTFRHTEFAEYKGTRRETPNELVVQFPVARDLMNALNIPSLELTGYEADDIVGTIAKRAEKMGYRTTIVTGDLDTLQLVDETISVMTTRQGVSDVVIYTPEAVQERYGFGPDYVVDYKALVGDTSDNIPGVPGVGEKTATKLIVEFGHVEQIIENIDKVEEKFRKKLEPNLAQIPKSKWLATIDCDAPVEYDFEPLKLDQAHLDRALSMLESLEFKSLLKKAPAVLGPYLEGGGNAVVEIVEATIEHKSVADKTDLAALQKWIGAKPFAAVPEQASGQFSMFDTDAARYSFVAVGNEAARVPHEILNQLLKQSMHQAVLHDAKLWMRQGAITDRAPRFDSLIAGYVLQSGRTNYALRDLIQGYLDVSPPDTAAGQAVALLQLEDVMRKKVIQEEQARVLDEIEIPLIPLLAEMESTGIAVSKDFLTEFSKSLEKDIDVAAKTVYELAGTEFLIGSPKQLGEILFEKLQIPGNKKTKTGYATGAEVLQQLAPSYPICAAVLTWRELSKLKSTYADALPKLVGEDGRIHTTYNQTVAATGRLSSNDPNLQNIPIRTELGRQIRKAFVADKGFKLASFDYSQIELRLLAHLCKDDVLVDAFEQRVDVHAVTAALMFGIEPDQVTKQQRRLAKMLNYAVLYGVTDFGLAGQLGEGFSVAEAKALITQYYERFPKVREFTKSIVEEARQRGYTVTLCGRRRYFSDLHAGNRTERMYAERQAINAPIQGGAADMIKLAMVRARKKLGSSDTKMLLQVHDELLFDLSDQEHGLIEPLRAEMENALPLDVPVEVDFKIGDNWSEMVEKGRN